MVRGLNQSNSVHFLTPCHLYLAVSFVHVSGLRCVMHFSLLPCVNQQILSEHDLYFNHSYTFRCLQTIRHQAVQKDKVKKYHIHFQLKLEISAVSQIYVHKTLLKGHAMAQLVEALRYKSEGRGFDSRWYHWNFSLT